MTKFRKKPVVIEAWQYLRPLDIDFTEPPEWLRAAFASGDAVPHGGDDPHLTIKTLEGEHRASVYDWVIQGVKGEIYPCKPDIFAATYEVLAISADHDHQLGFEDGDQSGSHSGEKHKYQTRSVP